MFKKLTAFIAIGFLVTPSGQASGDMCLEAALDIISHSLKRKDISEKKHNFESDVLFALGRLSFAKPKEKAVDVELVKGNLKKIQDLIMGNPGQNKEKTQQNIETLQKILLALIPEEKKVSLSDSISTAPGSDEESSNTKIQQEQPSQSPLCRAIPSFLDELYTAICLSD